MLTATITGYPEFVAKTTALNKSLDLDEILDEATAALLARLRANFLAQTDPDGNPWVPSLAAQLREKTGRGGGTLFDSGRLFHSIQAYVSGNDERAIGTNVPYAVVHNEGLNGQLKRVFLGFGQADVDLATKLVQFRVNQAWNT